MYFLNLATLFTFSTSFTFSSATDAPWTQQGCLRTLHITGMTQSIWVNCLFALTQSYTTHHAAFIQFCYQWLIEISNLRQTHISYSVHSPAADSIWTGLEFYQVYFITDQLYKPFIHYISQQTAIKLAIMLKLDTGRISPRMSFDLAKSIFILKTNPAILINLTALLWDTFLSAILFDNNIDTVKPKYSMGNCVVFWHM